MPLPMLILVLNNFSRLKQRVLRPHLNLFNHTSHGVTTWVALLAEAWKNCNGSKHSTTQWHQHGAIVWVPLELQNTSAYNRCHKEAFRGRIAAFSNPPKIPAQVFVCSVWHEWLRLLFQPLHKVLLSVAPDAVDQSATDTGSQQRRHLHRRNTADPPPKQQANVYQVHTRRG